MEIAEFELLYKSSHFQPKSEVLTTISSLLPKSFPWNLPLSICYTIIHWTLSLTLILRCLSIWNPQLLASLPPYWVLLRSRRHVSQELMRRSILITLSSTNVTGCELARATLASTLPRSVPLSLEMLVLLPPPITLLPRNVSSVERVALRRLTLIPTTWSRLR